ncbi:MAG: tRNA 2-thiouridine(34) synthase MnmA [Lachnospiraceae bacterium]
MEKKALVAMSGGVDSSVAAYLMKQQGYEVMGVTMKLYDNEDIGESREKSCCTLSDVEDARNVANTLNIPYYVFNFREQFGEKVIKRFVDTYLEGGTPNPCVDCNRHLKFTGLMHKMYELGYDYVVTGHYARIEQDKQMGRFLLKKGMDETKDQSYMLYSMNQQQLAHTLFPLGEYCKTEIRQIAEENGFVNARKHDSQDICFVPDGDYGTFIDKYLGRTSKPGNFVLRDGTVLGQHKGIIRYTVGQRKGLGIAYRVPLYVIGKDLQRNEVILGELEELYQSELYADDINLISVERIDGELRCKAKIRYRQKEEWATVTQEGDKLHVVFDTPQRGITAGQALVLYDDDVVVGGGTILSM